MIELVTPEVSFHDSWVEAVAEFGEEPMHGSGLWDLDRGDLSPAALEREIARLLAEADESIPPKPGWVHCSYYWIVADGAFVGYLAMRHRLNESLLEEGGHIGYSVRPSRRRQGVAGTALALALPMARERGIERALVTCDEDNEGSRRTIERNGGVLEDVRADKRRYWIDLT